MRHRPQHRPGGEAAALLTLGELRDTQVDMFTTVFVGNSQTKVIGGKMVTPGAISSGGNREIRPAKAGLKPAQGEESA